MTISFSFDIENTTTNNDDRMRINLAFQRFGWESAGGSSWRYPALGTDKVTPDDWFNHIIPALFYFRSLVSARGLNVPKFSIDAHSSSGYRSDKQFGTDILPSDAFCFHVLASDVSDGTQSKLSEKRLRDFLKDSEDSLR